MSGFTFQGKQPLKPAPVQKASVWHTFRHRVFFWLALAALVSNIGTWMQNIGAAWLMTTLSPSPLLVALIQTASSLPIVLLAMPAGALADIIDRRKLLLFSQAWMLVASAALGALTIAGMTTPVSLLLLTLALGVGSALNAPAWQAIVPELVPRSELTAAISLNSISFNASRAVGPALGGLVVAWTGAGATFVLNAVSFLAVIVVLFEWRHPQTVEVLPAERIMGAIRAGIRYIRYAPQLQAVMVRCFVFIFGGSAVWAIIPLLARYQLGQGAAGFGGLLGCFGAGAMIAGTLLPELRFSRHAISAAATGGFALLMAALAFTHNPPLAYVLMALMGGCWTVQNTVMNIATQLSVPFWVQGRALAAFQVLFNGGMAGGAALWGYVAERMGIPITLALAAASILLGLTTMFKFRLATDAELDLTPAPIHPMPEAPVAPDSGPVLISVEYMIDPAQAVEFSSVMEELRRIRLRDGAVFWGLFFDANQPRRFVEYFLIESWAEHLRQHDRTVSGDVLIENMARAYHRGEEPPRITHQVSAERVETLLRFDAFASAK